MIRGPPRCCLLGRLSFGGSLMRPEATGYGLVYFVQEMLEDKGDSLKVRRLCWRISNLFGCRI